MFGVFHSKPQIYREQIEQMSMDDEHLFVDIEIKGSYSCGDVKGKLLATFWQSLSLRHEDGHLALISKAVITSLWLAVE